MRTPRTFLMALVAGLFLLPVQGEAQARGQGGPGGPMMMMAGDPVERVLEHAEALELTLEQRSELEAFHAASLGRSAEARELVKEMRERMEARRDAMRSERGERPRGDRMRGERPREGRARGERPRGDQTRGERGSMTMDPALREAMETIREERRAGMELVRSTLDAEQLEKLRELRRPERPGRPGPRGGRG
jgi:hypothetical protein